ncbi:alpha-1,6-mannosyltransferase [Actinoplanes lutulentus]|uniref:Alpha-1,6-mannosyltransferase n=1 Tax=Actinoplanes lutulentus TaxID=1287878 RepID=A0A327ZFX8_9ACTN|nr:polyprenol phosphomannose-dependent alpha 1,6 mannosyltransferase MptB [Actinoplanes lutulentus]MBB2941783.1 alpha-1,6-mannosyltransferase [Actinoplanes lutulentus]RAK39703.1 alpha-1,6-mannosyltransferase [Actinoplanes lutulentus]
MPRPSLVRYTGLAGSLLLAVAAWLGGASSPWKPNVTPGTIFSGDNGVLLPVSWLAGTVLLIGAWWVGRRDVPSLRWAYLTAALWAAPLVPFLPLASYDVYSYACQGWQQAAGLDPYSGGVDLLGCPWADAVSPTWSDAPAPYGPVFLVLAALAATVGGSLAGTVAVLRLIAVLSVAVIGWCLPMLARRAGVPPERAVWLFLACPLVPIHLISGAHNDAVMVALLVAGLAVAQAAITWPRMIAAGVLLGLAVGVKATAVVVLPFALLLLPKPWWRAAVALGGGAVAALVGVSLGAGLGLGWVTGLSGSGVSVQWTALPTAVGLTLEVLGVPSAVPVTRVLGMITLAVVLVVLWVRAFSRDAVHYAGLALAATVLLAPVFHPWYALWPLAVLAATVRKETRWLVAPFAVAAALCLPDGYNLALVTKTQGAVGMTVLAGCLAWKVLHEANQHSRRPGAAHGGGDRLHRAP